MDCASLADLDSLDVEALKALVIRTRSGKPMVDGSGQAG